MLGLEKRISTFAAGLLLVGGAVSAVASIAPASASAVASHLSTSGLRTSRSAERGAADVIGAFPLQNYGAGLAGNFLCVTTGGKNDNPASLYTCNGSKEQTWGWGKTISGSFKQLINGDGQCLGVTGGSKSQNARVVGWTCLGTSHPDQYWSVGSCLSLCVFFNYHSGYVLSVLNGSTALNAAVVQASYNSNRNDQFWYW